MNLPLPANTTCDIYHGSNLPPSPPDVPAVRIVLQADYRGGQEHGEGRTQQLWTHLALVSLEVDVRDDFNTGTGSGSHLYVPDQSGTDFLVVFVERVRTGNPLSDYKRVYLKRNSSPWPTNEL